MCIMHITITIRYVWNYSMYIYVLLLTYVTPTRTEVSYYGAKRVGMLCM